MKNWRSLAMIGAVVVTLNFLVMPREDCDGDAWAVRLQSITILNQGRWAVPPEVATTCCGPRGLVFYQTAKGDWYPKYGLLNMLIYLPPLGLEKILTGQLSYQSDHTLFLNLWNLVFSAMTAVYLALFARRYTTAPFIVWLFVLASIFGTFWWNYLRAQVFESYVTLFVLAAFFHFLTAGDARVYRKVARHLFLAGLFLGLLCLAKTIYVVLVPLFCIALFVRQRSPTQPTARKTVFIWFLLPVVMAIIIVGWGNWYRFGSPVATGYTQFERERQLFAPNLAPALFGFLFSKQRSVLIYFPVLILALLAWPRFWRRYRFDAAIILGPAAVIFLLNCAFTNWRGGECYGPRYLLPVLPLLSLPAVELMQKTSESGSFIKRALAAVFAVVLGWSCVLQMAVNSVPFYFWYDLYDLADNDSSVAAKTYMMSRHIGTVDLEFTIYSLGWPSPIGPGYADHLSTSALGRFEVMRIETLANYYWWPKPFLRDY